MRLDQNDHRIVIIEDEDITEANKLVDDKEQYDTKKIPRQSNLLGQIGYLLSKFWLKQCIITVQKQGTPIFENGTFIGIVHKYMHLDIEDIHIEQNHGERLSEPDLKILNIENSTADGSEVLLEVKAKSCPLNSPGDLSKYVSSPEILFTMDFTEWNQLKKHPNGHSLIWGVCLKSKKAYCYFFRNKDIVQMLQSWNSQKNQVEETELSQKLKEAENKSISKGGLDGWPFIQCQLKIWNKNRIQSKRKELGKNSEGNSSEEDPFIHISTILSYAQSRSKKKIIINPEGKIIDDTQMGSVNTYRDFLRIYLETYPKLSDVSAKMLDLGEMSEQ